MDHRSKGSSRTPSISPATLLAILGGVFVVIALISLIQASWETLHSGVRGAVVGLPTALLLGAGLAGYRHEHSREVSVAAVVTGIFGVPFAAGVILFEGLGLHRTTQPLIAAAVGIGLLIAAIILLWAKVRELTPIVLGYGFLWALSLGRVLDTVPEDRFLATLAAIALSVVALCIMPFLHAAKRPLWSKLAGAMGLFGLAVSAGLGLPARITNLMSFPPVSVPLHTLALAGIAVAAAALLLGAAVYFHRIHKETNDRDFAHLRRWTEAAALLPLFFFIGESTFWDTEALFPASVGLLLSAFTVLASLRLALFGWRILGAIACVFSFFAVVVSLMGVLPLSGPLVLLAIGIILFLAAFFLVNKQSVQMEKGMVQQPEGWYGLGSPLPDAPTRHRTVNQTVKEDGTVVEFVAETKSAYPFVGWTMLILILTLFVHSLLQAVR